MLRRDQGCDPYDLAHGLYHIGGLGWELFWKWHVAVWIWDTMTFFDSTSPCRHGADVSDRRRQFFVDEYERGLRGVVQRELVDYQFDHTEHGRDVGYAMQQAGLDYQCDAHGVGAYLGAVADMDTVRGVFDEMSKVWLLEERRGAFSRSRRSSWC